MPDFVVTIDVKDVAKGDIRGLVDGIMETFGEDFDASRGDFTILASEKIDGKLFLVDLDDDE